MEQLKLPADQKFSFCFFFFNNKAETTENGY